MANLLRHRRLHEVESAFSSYHQIELLKDFLWLRPVVIVSNGPKVIVGKQQILSHWKEENTGSKNETVKNHNSEEKRAEYSGINSKKSQEVEQINIPVPEINIISPGNTIFDFKSTTNKTVLNDQSKVDISVSPCVTNDVADSSESKTSIENTLSTIDSCSLKPSLIRQYTRPAWLINSNSLNCTPASPRFLAPKTKTNLNVLEQNLHQFERVRQQRRRRNQLKTAGELPVIVSNSRLLQPITPSAIARERTKVTLDRIQVILHEDASVDSEEYSHSMLVHGSQDSINTENTTFDDNDFHNFLDEMRGKKLHCREKCEQWLQTHPDG